MSRRGGRPARTGAAYGAALIVILVLGACAASGSNGVSSRSTGEVVATAGARDGASLTGAGSTASAPLVDEWLRLYRVAAPGVSIDYASPGTPAAIARLQAGNVDFAVLDGPLTPGERQTAGGSDAFVQVPVAGGALAVTYNLPGVEALSLSARTLAGIFGGSVTRWDDPEVRRDNPSTTLPGTRISVIHRSDPSATTLALTEYLQAAAPAVWDLSAGREVSWPAGRGATGSSAAMEAVQATPGAVGYAGLAVARQAGLAVASVENGAGAFVAPSVRSVEAAMGRAVGNEQDLTLTVPHPQEAPAAYPIVVVTNLLFPAGLGQPRDQALRNLAAWILNEGQRSAERLAFAPLPLPLLVRTVEGLQHGDARPRR